MGKKNYIKLGGKRHQGQTPEFRTSLSADNPKNRQKATHTLLLHSSHFFLLLVAVHHNSTYKTQISHQILLLSRQVSASDFTFNILLMIHEENIY